MRIGKLFSLFLIQIIYCGYSNEPSQWVGSFSTKNTCLNWWVRKYLQIYAIKISLSGSMKFMTRTNCIPLVMDMNFFYNLRAWNATKVNILQGLHIRVHIGKLFSLFLIQNIYCVYSKEPYQWHGSFEHQKHIFKLMDKKKLQFLAKKICLTGPNILPRNDVVIHGLQDWVIIRHIRNKGFWLPVSH